MAVELVSSIYPPPPSPDHFLERLAEGKVRSWVILWSDVPDAESASMRYSTEVYNRDAADFACALWTLAENYRNKVASPESF